MKTFESLYRDYYQKVYAFLNRMCADGDLAEDLTQETFLQAYKSLYKFRGECEVFTWLAAIGKHTYFKYLKKEAAASGCGEFGFGGAELSEGGCQPGGACQPEGY